MPGRRVSARATIAVGAFAVVFGLGVLVTEGMPALRDGRTVLGLIVTACAVVGIALGVSALIAVARRGRGDR